MNFASQGFPERTAPSPQDGHRLPNETVIPRGRREWEGRPFESFRFAGTTVGVDGLGRAGCSPPQRTNPATMAGRLHHTNKLRHHRSLAVMVMGWEWEGLLDCGRWVVELCSHNLSVPPVLRPRFCHRWGWMGRASNFIHTTRGLLGRRRHKKAPPQDTHHC